MAKQEIDIGVEGNDGTGDSIRESFKKVNDNFGELYAVFGLGGQISFTTLNDTPNSTAGEEGKVLLVKQDGTGVDFFELVSNAGNADPNDPNNTIAFNVDGNKLKLRVINVDIESDKQPTISNPLKLGASVAYGETTHRDILRSAERETLTAAWNDTHGEPFIDDDNILLSGGLGDRKYLSREVMGTGVRIRDERAESELDEYTLTIDGYATDGSKKVQVTAHGLTESATGAGYKFSSTITDPTGLKSGDVYHLRREDDDNVTLHLTSADAINDANRLTIAGGIGVQTLTDDALDATLEGNWLSNEALPRKSIVRREGDTMTGALNAHDHPFPYNGSGIVQDPQDLQVATKFYVDAQLGVQSENIYVSLEGTDDHSLTPAGKEGRSPNYAYRSVGAAMQKAARIQEASAVELGPYIQTLTFTESLTVADTFLRNVGGGLGFNTTGDQTTVITTIEANLRTIVDETIAAVNVQFPDFVYNESTCRRDLELIINAVKLDIGASTTTIKQNTLSRSAGLKYFSNPSGEIAIDNNGQYAQTSYALTVAKIAMLADLTAAGVGVGNAWYAAVGDNWDTVLDTINQTTADPAIIESTNYYTIYLESGANGFVDQAGDPAAGTPNVDIFPGKVIRGKRSGAIGTIVEYTRGADDGGVDYDTVTLQLLEPIDFVENEKLEYGAFVKKRQISVRVESGTYEEQFPIKLPSNISIKGDEFRRTVIRPAAGPSTSPYANTWFYRDEFVDGLSTATGGTDEWIDDLTGLRRGFFGYHYLSDPTSPMDISDFGKNNKGGFLEAADLIRFNRAFLVEETIAWIATQVAGPIFPFTGSFVYDEAKCRRDTGFIVDGIVKDLQKGGRVFSGENQVAYYSGSVAGQEAQTKVAIEHLKDVIPNLLVNDSTAGYTASTGNTEPQVFNTNYTAETGAVDQANELVDYVAYAFDTDYNPAKNNNEMDVFLCGDNTIVRNLTCQRHGGFMMVLDPEEAVRTRSPYAQTNTSFARSLNKKAFHGGMFIDGYTYNMPMTITSKDDFFTLNVEAPIGSGLNIRKPELPCSFFEFGRRYQVNAIRNYTTGVSETDGVTTVQKATLVLDLGSHDGIGLDDDIDSAAGPVPIILQGAGNRSMLANDYTQINDLGYGVIATNNALSELVSVFTYYAHTGYLSLNGAQIRSLTGNNSYGDFGLVAEGSDPDEIATQITLEQDLTQPVKMFTADQLIELTGTGLGIVRNDIIEQVSSITANTAKGKVVFSYEEGGNTILWITRVIDEINLFEYSFNDADTITDDTTPTPVSYGAPVEVTTLPTRGVQGQAFAYFFDATNLPMNGAQLEVHHTDSDLTFQPYEVVSVSESIYEIPASSIATDCFSANTDIKAKIYRADFTSGTGDAATENTGLRFNIAFGDLAVMTAQQNLLLNGVSSATLTRPSTALIFDEQEQVTYRTLAFENTVVGSTQTNGIQSRVTIDDNFDYVDLTVRNDFADHPIASYSLAGGTTLGRTVGDQYIAVNALSNFDADRINNTTEDMILTWNGRVHIVTAYTEVTDAVDGTGSTFGIVTLTNKYDITNSGTTGLLARADSAAGNNITLQLGLQEAEAGNVTVNISTCRATGHDFLDIGTGGYNTTNYPDRVFGAPIKQAVSPEASIDSEGLQNKAQVQERSRGRVFFASTDQDGFFRVGRFFTVDQGTGRITFNAALVLTNIDGIGFKRGVRVNEFSADETFTNASADAVPVETAVEGYINRRLGWDRNGNTIGDADIIPASTGGALALSGVTTMRGDLRYGGFRGLDLASPVNGTDAANKNYVDAQVALYDTLEEMEDTNIDDTTSLAANHFLVWDASLNRWINTGFDTGDNGASPAIPNSDFVISKNGSGNLIGSYQPNSLTNADVNSTAGISQSKLSMTAATTRANATGITQANLGLASFDSANFEATDGWIRVKTGGISNAELAGSIANTKLVNDSITFADGGGTSSAVDLGDTVTIQGTSNEITVSYNGSGTYTLGLTATFETDVTGDIFTNVSNPKKVLDNGVWDGSAYTTLPSFDGEVEFAKDVEVGSRGTDANHYLTFVDSNNATRGYENLYTDAGIVYNPSSNRLDIAGELECNTLDVNGSMTITGSVTPDGSSTQNMGSSASPWDNVYGTTFHGTATEALWADLAENYLGDAQYEPGTVLVFGGEQELTTTNAKGDTRVAGIVTTNPAHLMNSALQGDYVVGLALQGRVPCKVLGKVAKGDMLVTAAKAGYAIVNNSPGIGQVIGKATGTKDDDGYGIVEVVVGRV